MLNLNSFMINSDKPEELKNFYEKVLGKKPDWSENDYYGFMSGGSFFMVGPHDQVKGENKNPQRLIFNFETKEVEKEFERIKKLGAKVIAKPYSMGDKSMMIATLSDPDGNYFQLVTPMK